METQILKFLVSVVGHCHTWKRGQIVELPSPAIEGRTDIIVIVFPRAEVDRDKDGVELYHPAGFIVRNKGRYSTAKSRKIAKAMGLLLDECEPYVPGAVTSYDDSNGMIGDVDPDAHWVDLIEHPSALVKLQKTGIKRKDVRVPKKRGKAA